MSPTKEVWLYDDGAVFSLHGLVQLSFSFLGGLLAIKHLVDDNTVTVLLTQIRFNRHNTVTGHFLW